MKKRKMRLSIKTLIPSLYIWQTFSMCQFTLNRKNLNPKLHPTHNVIAATSFTIQIGVFIFSLFYITKYVDLTGSIVLGYNDAITSLLNRLIPIVVVVESYLKRSQQMKFLNLIEDVDDLLVRRLQLNTKWKANHKRNLNQLIIRICHSIVLNVLTIYTSKTDGLGINYDLYWYLIAIPVFMGSMQYHQVICFTQLISDRYEALNECIRTLQLIEPTHLINSPIFTISIRKETKSRKYHQSILITKKLNLILIAHNLLDESYSMLRGLFSWSMIFSFSADFQGSLTSGYYIVISVLDRISLFQFLTTLIWSGFSVYSLLVILTACRKIEIEVS